jgi:nucleotide-binding universal stress UspA family protein
MNKFIAAFDGLNFSESNCDYAVAFAKSEKAHLTGVFLDDKTYTSYKIYELVIEEGVSEHKLKKLKHEDQGLRIETSKKFESICHEASIEYNIHHDNEIAVQELLHESIFADLLIVNKDEKFVHHEEKFPSRFIKDILSHSQCPVMVTPEDFLSTEKIILLYNGEPNSVYAIRMFTYLLSSFQALPVEIIMVKKIEDNSHFPDHKLLKEFLRRHFPATTYTILKGIPEEEIVSHLKLEKKNFITVLGAYRRTMVSRWFQSSMADALMKNFNMPIFIAHNK